ncbi:hypothetical protein ACFO9Q_07190 [Paenibacillus sp. GCM10023252]|uniref:hypothetical protein n=1 Tax=Paenibacillus sp. GCM10023252 TaxID=3252649 RepID=UPI00361C6D79
MPSEYAKVLKEVKLLDTYLSSGYVIAYIREDLEGAHVKLAEVRTVEPIEAAPMSVQLLLTTAEARRILAVRLIAQQQQARQEPSAING